MSAASKLKLQYKDQYLMFQSRTYKLRWKCRFMLVVGKRYLPQRVARHVRMKQLQSGPEI